MIKPNTAIFLVAITVLAVIHYFAIELYLYWLYPWFDLVTHTLGGAAIALGLFSLKDFYPRFSDRFHGLFPTLAVVCLTAIAWEVFEVSAGISMEEPEYALDTVIDLGLGLTGGLIGFFVGKSIRELNV